MWEAEDRDTHHTEIHEHRRHQDVDTQEEIPRKMATEDCNCCHQTT